jgi:predicted Fe-Mo cluster-binding NifX family protein
MENHNILIPVRGEGEDAKITLIAEREKWALVEVGSGKIQQIRWYEDRSSIDTFIDMVVVKSRKDAVADFFADSIPVLEAPLQRTIDDIFEAYMFKELYEVPIQF